MSWERGTSDRSETLPSDWKAIRKRILRRDGGICYVCGLPGANGVDHVDQSRNDDHSDGNLAAIHSRPCHSLKSSREGRAARRTQRRETEPPPGLVV